MQLSDFDYSLPKELIAQYPLEKRDASRLMILNRITGALTHSYFCNLIDFLSSSDVLVINDTKVFPARVHGFKKDTGGKIEVLLLREVANPDSATKHDSFPEMEETGNRGEERSCWEVLLNKGKGIKEGSSICFGNGELIGLVRKFNGNGKGIIEFNSFCDIFKVLDKIGETPLPPYVKRRHGAWSMEHGEGEKLERWEDGLTDHSSLVTTPCPSLVTAHSSLTTDHSSLTTSLDRDRYQTVYAKENGAVAAPTAGLHFTGGLLEKIKRAGAEILNITLHVGLGTFKPVRVNDIKEHIMESERYTISPEVAESLNKARESKKRIIAVGTTTARALETEMQVQGKFTGGEKETNLFIYPGFQFKAVNALITNFHLPKSTLLMLASSFCGLESTLESYKEAINRKYRFYSYGDAMFII